MSEPSSTPTGPWSGSSRIEGRPSSRSFHGSQASIRPVQVCRRTLPRGRGPGRSSGDIHRSVARAQGRFDEAKAAYRSALRQREGFLPAIRDMGQMIWMRFGEGRKLSTTLF